jgi:hypothetical protein
MRRFTIILLIALSLSYIVYVAWLYEHGLLFYRRVVLETPIVFKEGFSLDEQFRTGPAGTYWVAIKYEKQFQITPTNQLPADEFTAAFSISSGGTVLARGGSDSFPEWSRPWNISKDYVIRLLAPFSADSRKSYHLLLQISRVLPSIGRMNPTAVVAIDPQFDRPGYSIRESFLIVTGILIVVMDAIYGLAILRQRP